MPSITLSKKDSQNTFQSSKQNKQKPKQQNWTFVDIKLQTTESQPLMILSPNKFAADQKRLEHFLQIVSVEMHTLLKTDYIQISQRMSTWALIPAWLVTANKWEIA